MGKRSKIFKIINKRNTPLSITVTANVSDGVSSPPSPKVPDITPEEHFKEAMTFFEKRNYDAAFPLFELAAKSHKHAAARYYLGLCFLRGYGTDINEIKAFTCFQVAAKLGHSQARCELGDCYLTGRGTALSAKLAFEQYKLAADAGDKLGEFKVSQCQMQGIGVGRDIPEGLKYLVQSSENSYLPAHYQLGLWYSCGDNDHKEDIEEAEKYFKLAAESGHPRGLYEHATVCKSEETKESQVESFTCFKCAADQGHHGAQNWVGWYLSEGNFVEEDQSLAFQYFQMAADQGNPFALHNVGACYENGEGIEQDLPKAFEHFLLAANDSYKCSLYKVGRCFKYGIGVKENLPEAVKYLTMSVEGGDGDAPWELGDCYKRGVGVEKDEKEAFKYFLMAAKEKVQEAQNEVGDCYRFGRGVEIDLDEAEKYYQLAIDQKYQKAKDNLEEVQNRREEATKRQREELPSWFFCPITHEVMEDPVICCDGNSYERRAIEDWLIKSLTSPLTNLPLGGSTVITNFNLKQSIKQLADKILHETVNPNLEQQQQQLVKQKKASTRRRTTVSQRRRKITNKKPPVVKKHQPK